MLPLYIILNCGVYDFNSRTVTRLIRISQNNEWIQHLFNKNNISKLRNFFGRVFQSFSYFFRINSFLQSKLQEKLTCHFFFDSSSSSNIISILFSIITHTGMYSCTYLNVVTINFSYGPLIHLPFRHSLTSSVSLFSLSLSNVTTYLRTAK